MPSEGGRSRSGTSIAQAAGGLGGLGRLNLAELVKLPRLSAMVCWLACPGRSWPATSPVRYGTAPTCAFTPRAPRHPPRRTADGPSPRLTSLLLPCRRRTGSADF